MEWQEIWVRGVLPQFNGWESRIPWIGSVGRGSLAALLRPIKGAFKGDSWSERDIKRGCYALVGDCLPLIRFLETPGHVDALREEARRHLANAA